MAENPITGSALDTVSDTGAVGDTASIEYLGAIAQMTILDRDLTLPPDEPEYGDAYIVAATGTGDWSGHDEEIAIYTLADEWAFIPARAGLRAWVTDEAALFVYNGTTWDMVGTQAAARADSTAGDLATLVSDFNDLLAKMRTSGLLAP